MTKTITGTGGICCIENTLPEIGLTRKGIIIATSEKRVFDWLRDYIKPHEEPRYAVRHAETEHDFDILAGKQRMAMAFIEDCFFGDKTPGKLDRLYRHYPKLRLIVFSVSLIPAGMEARYVSWSHGGCFSLRDTEKEIRKSLDAVFSRRLAIPLSIRDSIDDYFRLPDIEPHLTRREIEVVRCIAEEKTAKKTASCLMVSEKTVTNHLSSVYQKFGIKNKVGVLKLAVSKGIIPVDELMTYTVQS